MIQHGMEGRHRRAVDHNVVFRVPSDVGNAPAWIEVVELDRAAGTDDF
jgi:hypothetical protein